MLRIKEEETMVELVKSSSKEVEQIIESLPENLIEDIKNQKSQSLENIKVMKCINNTEASYFIKDYKKTVPFYECPHPSCADITYMCNYCAENCHSHYLMESKPMKEVMNKNVKCGCALKNHIIKETEIIGTDINKMLGKRLKVSKFQEFLKFLKFNYWAKQTEGEQHICIFCYENCPLKSKSDYHLVEAKNDDADSYKCSCCVVEKKHDVSFMKRKTLSYLVNLKEEDNIKFDKFSLIGKVFFNDNFYIKEFQEFNDTNLKIMNREEDAMKVKFTNSYLQVVEYMVNLTDRSKDVLFDISDPQLEQIYQLKSFNFKFLQKVTSRLARIDEKDPSDFSCGILPKMLYFFRYYYLYSKTHIKNVKLISKHRENISPLHRYFFKDYIDEFYNSVQIEKSDFNEMMDNIYEIIKNLLKKGVDTNNLAELIRQYLQFLELFLCYRMDLENFNQICVKVLGILKYYKTHSILHYSKHEDNNISHKNEEVEADEETLKKLSIKKLNRDIRKFMPLLVICLNDIEFEKRVFHSKSIESKNGYFFQVGEIQKIILQIFFYSEKKNFSGLYIYHSMLVKNDSYIDNVRYMLNAKENFFDEKFYELYQNRYNPNLFKDRKLTKLEEQFNNYEEIKQNYFINGFNSNKVGSNRSKDRDPLIAIKTFAESITNEIKAFLSLTSQDDKYAKQLYLMKKGYMEIVFDMFKLVTCNNYFKMNDTQKATGEAIIDTILKKILPSLIEGNAFLGSLFFSVKLVNLFFKKSNKNHLFKILKFYSIILKSIIESGIKINVRFILDRITKKTKDGFLSKKQFNLNNQNEFEPISIEDLKNEFGIKNSEGKIDQKDFDEKLRIIFQSYKELLCVVSENAEVYINDLMVNVAINILQDKYIKDLFERYILQLNEKFKKIKKDDCVEEVTLKIFEILNTISNNYFYLLNKYIPIETLKRCLILYDKLNPLARMIIQKLYIRHKMKFPYKTNTKWRDLFDNMLNVENSQNIAYFCIKDEEEIAKCSLQKNNEFENIEKEYLDLEIVKRILTNFPKMMEVYEKDYFKNNPEFLLKFFEDVVLSTTLYTLYKIIYFNSEINNILKYYIYSIVYLFLLCLRNVLWTSLEKPKSDMEAYTLIFQRHFNIPDQKDSNDDEDIRLFFEDFYQKVELQIKKINQQGKFLNHQKFIQIFSEFASKFNFYNKQNNHDYIKHKLNYQEYHNKFYKNMNDFYSNYKKKKMDKSNNILHAILKKNNDDELFQTLKMKIVDDLIYKLKTYGKRREIKNSIQDVNNNSIGFGLRDILKMVEKTMAIAPEVYQKKILEHCNSDLIQNDFVNLITEKLPYLFQFTLIEFSNNNIVEDIPFLGLFKYIISLLEHLCKKSEVLSIFIAKCKVDPHSKNSIKFEDLLIKFLHLIIVNLKYYDEKKSMLELLNKNDNQFVHKTNFFNTYIQKIFGLLGKLVIESKIPLFTEYEKLSKKTDADINKNNNDINIITDFNKFNEKSLDLFNNISSNSTFNYYIYNYIMFLDIISFEYNKEYDVKIKNIQSILIYCFNNLLQSDNKEIIKINNNSGQYLLDKVLRTPSILQQEIFLIFSKIYIFVYNIAELTSPASQKFNKFLNNLKDWSEKEYIPDSKIESKDEDEVKMSLGQIYLFFKKLIKNVEIVYTKNTQSVGNISDVNKTILGKMERIMFLNPLEKKWLVRSFKEKRGSEKLRPIQIYFVAHPDALKLDEIQTIDNFMAISKFHEGSNQKLLSLMDYYAFLNTKVNMVREYAKHNENNWAAKQIKESTPLEYISAIFSVITNLSVLLSLYYNNPLDLTSSLSNPLFYFTLFFNLIHLLFLGFCIGVMSYKEWITYKFFLKNDNNSNDYFENFANKQIYPLAWNFFFGFIAILHPNLNFLLSLQMFSLFYLFGTMRAAIESVQSKYKQFLAAGFLILIFIIFYSFISVMFFKDSFFNSDLDENMCDSVFHCIISLLSNGVRSGAGIGFSIVSPTNPGYWSQFIFEWVFYFTIILVMLNIINGIIVDTFQSMRNTNEINEKKRDNLCFICSISRSVFESHGQSFKTHCLKDHNIFNYMQFILKIKNSEFSCLNSAEKYVLKKIKKSRTDFFPIKKCRNLNI